MPCSRTLAPLAQCAPMLKGESNTGSWRTHTPSCTTASIEQPTEQCVQTVRFTSVLPALATWALASPTMLSGSWLAKAATPAPMPDFLRNARRSSVFSTAAAGAARATGSSLRASPDEVRVRIMGVSSGAGGFVVALHVLGEAVAAGLRRGRLHRHG